jgi:hypothetical protein
MSFSQTKWKRFHSKGDDYALILPNNFEIGPRLSGGIIQWFMDTNRMDIQIWVETSSNNENIGIIFEDHKKNFTHIKYEELSKNWFVISGSEGIGIGQLNHFETGQTYFIEKCIIKKNRMCILRILYSDYSKTFIDDHIGKINESFK